MQETQYDKYENELYQSYFDGELSKKELEQFLFDLRGEYLEDKENYKEGYYD